MVQGVINMIKFFVNWFDAIAVAQQRRADYWILQNMTDKELKDIGIARGEIIHKVFQV
tara:strand:+ start:812 stop:985 length:174 start_codon:yes stop_codon:yes gene_type:complete